MRPLALRRVRGHATVDRWIALSRSGALVELSHALMVDHYDPAYAKSRKLDERSVLATVASDTLDDDGQERLSDRIATLVSAQ